MKYRPNFLKEVDRFARSATDQDHNRPTEEGLLQFFLHESRGIDPANPDPYFKFLLDGKRWWEWTLNFAAEKYLTDEWVGWYIHAIDFIADDSGFKQLRMRCHCDPIGPIEVINSCLLPGQFIMGLGI